MPISLTSIPGKVVEQIILELSTKHVKEKKVIGSSHLGFTKGKSCLTNAISMMAWQYELMRGEQWMSSTLISARLLPLSPVISS